MEKINFYEVYGGSGFVGSHLAPAPFSMNFRSREDYYCRSKDVIYLISTVDNYNVLNSSFIDIDTNLMVLMKVLDKWRAWQTETGEKGTFNFISSWFVYGNQEDPDLPVSEDAPCNPKGFYSITKRTAEQLLVSYCETFKLNYRILRLGNVIGPGDKKVSARKNALQYMINKMKNNEPIELYGNGQFYRDYIHVKDVGRAINLIVTKGQQNSIYNIGNGPTAWKFRDIIYYARRKLDSSSKITNIEPKEFHKVVQVQSFKMNNDKLKLLGYTPSYTMEEAIETLL